MHILQTVLSLLPLLIHGAEQIHGAGNGQAKAATVLNAAMQVVGAILPPDKQEAVANGIKAVIDGTVAVLNASGALHND